MSDLKQGTSGSLIAPSPLSNVYSGVEFAIEKKERQEK